MCDFTRNLSVRLHPFDWNLGLVHGAPFHKAFVPIYDNIFQASVGGRGAAAGICCKSCSKE